jgi:hypothetical protein
MTNKNHKAYAAGQLSSSPRSLPVSEWPAADRQAWDEACRPGFRLRRGGAASRYAEATAARVWVRVPSRPRGPLRSRLHNQCRDRSRTAQA